MELIVTVFLVEALPRRYKWSAIRPDESRYAGSSEPHFGAAIKAQGDADRAFRNPSIKWDLEFARHATEEVGKPVYRGHVFVSQEAVTRSSADQNHVKE
jgi:hypothetical protein